MTNVAQEKDELEKKKKEEEVSCQPHPQILSLFLEDSPPPNLVELSLT